jgi:signal transduction histidine kinase
MGAFLGPNEQHFEVTIFDPGIEDHDTERDGGPGQPSELEHLRARVEELELGTRSLEDQVRSLHRVKTVMDLLSGVAHDLGSALTGLVWCSEAIQRRLDNLDPDFAAGLSDVVSAADYARDLARRLLAIARQREGQFAALRIQEVVQQASALAETLRPHTASLIQALHAPEAWVWGNAEQLQQVIVNLTTNAFDAVGPGGLVEVQLDELPPETPGARAYLRMRVRDNGHGMTPDVLARAFEPFFTTKGTRDGNGLGLAVVQSIVARHGGSVSAQSSSGRGTSIDVLLPQADASPAAQPA